MTERKWTPGPWRLGDRYKSIVADNDTGWDDEESIRAYSGHMVCESVDDRNANLISAAPELYDAGYGALDSLIFAVAEIKAQAYIPDEDMDMMIERVEALKAALAKARGEK